MRISNFVECFVPVEFCAGFIAGVLLAALLFAVTR